MSGHCAKSTFPFESVGVSKMFGAAKGDAAYARQASSPVMTYSNSSDNMALVALLQNPGELVSCECLRIP